MNSKVVILAGGKSERFWPLSDKALFPFLGKPLICHQIDRAKKAGFKDLIVVCNQENLSAIKGFKVKAVLQKGEGQGAAVLSAREFLSGPTLIVNANDLFDLSLFSKVVRAGKKKGIDGCLVGFKTPSYFPGGYLIIDQRKRLKKIVEKPDKGKEPSNLVRIVVDFFKKGEKLVQYVEKKILYEEAIQAMIDDGMVFKVVLYEGEWGYLKYPWHVLPMTDFFLKEIKKPFIFAEKNDQGEFIGKDVQIAKNAVVKGKVILEDKVKIFENAVVIGPSYIGSKTVIGNNALVRQSMIGRESVIGFSTEVTRSYVGEACWFHSNYIGDSVLEKNVSLGAGTVLANLRLDERDIYSVVKKERINTQRTKLGAVIGQNVRVGANSSIMPGVKIGKDSFIGSGVVLERDLSQSKFCCLQRQNLVVKENFRSLGTGGRKKFFSDLA